MNTSLTLSVDGKEIRSTEKMDIYEEPIHIVSAHISELKMTLAQETVAGKSNETPAMQNLIKSLEIEGYMVVADALNCQIDTAQAIIEKKADYLLCAKDNQPTLKSDIEDYVQTAALRANMDRAQTSERGHGRKEIRTAFTTDDVEIEVHIIALACGTPPEGYSKWTLRLLADKCVELKLVESLSHTTVSRVLKKMNINLI